MGGGADKESQSPCTITPRAGGQSVNKAASILFVIHGASDHSTRNGSYHCWVLPPVCLSSVITRCHRISQAFPLHSCILQILEVGTAWEFNKSSRVLNSQYDPLISSTHMPRLLWCSTIPQDLGIKKVGHLTRLRQALQALAAGSPALTRASQSRESVKWEANHLILPDLHAYTQCNTILCCW